MSDLLFPRQTVTLTIRDDPRHFPVRRVYCIGRNYAAHAREMGHDPDREPPFFFMKPDTAIQPIRDDAMADHPFPPATQDYHHEIEMVACLGSGGRDIPVETALDHVIGYAVGLDMTRRDRQDEAKRLSRPWEIAKAADFSGIVGPITLSRAAGHPVRGEIRLNVAGVDRQRSDIDRMIWSVAEQVAILSRHFALEAGDIVFSGTPEGVGRVERGQAMIGGVEGLGGIAVRVV